MSITRLRHGKKVCFAERKATSGAPQIYGEDWYLRAASGDWSLKRKEQTIIKYQRSIYEKEPDEQTVVFTQTKKGRELRIEIRRWNEMLMHTSDGYSMKEAEFDVVSFRVLDRTTGERVFTEDVFVSVSGAERKRLKLKEVYQRFRRRFDAGSNESIFKTSDVFGRLSNAEKGKHRELGVDRPNSDVVVIRSRR